ncbi:hypothetical protein TNCV_2006291, partial [Trichonephila clavipes]
NSPAEIHRQLVVVYGTSFYVVNQVCGFGALGMQERRKDVRGGRNSVPVGRNVEPPSSYNSSLTPSDFYLFHWIVTDKYTRGDQPFKELIAEVWQVVLIS